MAYSTTLLFFACSSLVVGFSVHPRVARQTDQSNPLQTYIEGFGSGTGGEGLNFGGFGNSNPEHGTSQGSNQGSGEQRNESQGNENQRNDSNTNSNNSPIQGLSGNGFGGFVPGMGGGIVDRFRNAINDTANDEIDSVKDSWRSVKNLAHSGIDTKSNITKTHVDLALMGPKFVKNLFLN